MIGQQQYINWNIGDDKKQSKQRKKPLSEDNIIYLLRIGFYILGILGNNGDI